jgi:hypothetical protein
LWLPQQPRSLLLQFMMIKLLSRRSFPRSKPSFSLKPTRTTFIFVWHRSDDKPNDLPPDSGKRAKVGRKHERKVTVDEKTLDVGDEDTNDSCSLVIDTTQTSTRQPTKRRRRH